MNSTINPNNSVSQKDFWDELHMDLLISRHNASFGDYHAILERNFIFSLFFRGCSAHEMTIIQKLLKFEDYGYLLLMEFTDLNKLDASDFFNDEFYLHHFIKNILKNSNNLVGPLINNRISILITHKTILPPDQQKEESINICNRLISEINNEFHIKASIGISSLRSIYSSYPSFVEVLTCLYYVKPEGVLHYTDITPYFDNQDFDYAESEKRLLEALRLRKTEAYDYFRIIMDWLRPFNDQVKRNKIFELLVLANHAVQMDNTHEAKYINYSSYVEDFMALKGDKIIEFAFQCFIYISSYVKSQSSIDYSNHIVQATKEYLEAHYTDDISLEDAAMQVNMSPQYFSKLIKKTTGFNFIDWLSTLRVKKAKELLTNSNLTVKEVCFMVGYKDPNYFSRIFKKRIGITPSEYIKSRSVIYQQ
ncbi:helix-turn-helix transcriptional regulator [Lachnospiraceae bacterium MD1]|uniref:Helix-turn-helix transcriptional regulator n=1 Tax=Variimorphobacter saccharofermentans TaxID=2755051 RepID=A0A839K4P0_9FIRM|nr:AraC family transcriptional regulator [Variimorphobacter saccharofermentans]MBB2184317.1 helix-turn-helix transcriptional regulator [Variimorphobacter saccharofermentans]